MRDLIRDLNRDFIRTFGREAIRDVISGNHVTSVGLSISGNQWQSMAISGHKWQSVVISGNQRQLAALTRARSLQIDLRVGSCDVSHAGCVVFPDGILKEALNMALLRVGRDDHEGRAVAMAAEAAWGQFGDR